MESIKVGLGDRSYPIYFGAGNLTEIGDLCRNEKLGKSVAIVTNPTVGTLYLDPVRVSLINAGFSVRTIEIPDGEQYKNSDSLAYIYDQLIEAGMDRSSFIVALGGGVVGDIAGFAAATYLRGIPFVQVPTTLLSQVDSSVGGKTGINHRKGKNLIGAFYQPVLVMIDVVTLHTLQEREFLSGLAEVIKYGAVLDKELFILLESSVDKILARDDNCLLEISKRSCAIKASVVEKDEREGGLRAVLNYGHTLGHAVETLTGYTKYLHGEAVAIGMALITRYAVHHGLASLADAERIIALIKSLRLPVDPPAFSDQDYLECVLRDKKVRDSGVTLVVNNGIGDFRFERVTDILTLLKLCGIGG